MRQGPFLHGKAARELVYPYLSKGPRLTFQRARPAVIRLSRPSRSSARIGWREVWRSTEMLPCTRFSYWTRAFTIQCDQERLASRSPWTVLSLCDQSASAIYRDHWFIDVILARRSVNLYRHHTKSLHLSAKLATGKVGSAGTADGVSWISYMSIGRVGSKDSRLIDTRSTEAVRYARFLAVSVAPRIFG